MYICLHEKYPVYLLVVNQNQIFSTDFQKYSNINFHANLPIGSRIFLCGQTYRQTGRSYKSLFTILRKRLKITKDSITVIFDKYPRNVLFTMQTYHVFNLKKKIFLNLDKFFGKYQSTWDF